MSQAPRPEERSHLSAACVFTTHGVVDDTEGVEPRAQQRLEGKMSALDARGCDVAVVGDGVGPRRDHFIGVVSESLGDDVAIRRRPLVAGVGRVRGQHTGHLVGCPSGGCFVASESQKL